MVKRSKVILPPQLPPEIDDDEVHVSDDDIDFVKANKQYAGFLTKLDKETINRHVVRVADHKEDELEALYEKRNRKAAALQKSRDGDGLQVDPVDALPIKTLDGELRYRTVKEWNSESMPSGNESVSGIKDTEGDKVVRLTKAERREKLKKSKKDSKKQANEEAKADKVEGNLHSEVLAKVEEDLSAEEVFSKKKSRVAEIGWALLEDPESNIKTLKELLQICHDEDHNIVKLGLLSLLYVFRDIIPGYRIRLPTEKELKMTISKEVKKTRFYESTLLRSYLAYLRRLESLEKQSTFHQVVVRCMCNLLEAVPHFNFREILLANIFRNISSPDDVIRKLCCQAVSSLFINVGKHGGEATLQAVRWIADLVKVHDHQLHPDSIEILLSLTFDEDLGKPEPVEDEKTKHKKQKLRQNSEEPKRLQGSDKKRSRQELMAKTREEVSADFKSVLSISDPKERRMMQSETLSAVFETYFRILKLSMQPFVSRSKANGAGGACAHPLLAPCLNGLGKFSHLIDLDFMGDLMECLKRLASGSLQSCLTVSERLQCCIVAFRVMRNNLDALNVDLQEFFVQLYNLLLEYRPDRDRGEVLADALRTTLWEGKQHDMLRSAAFIKRLATFSLCFGSPEAMAALVTLKHLLQKNSKCRNLLENDPGGGSLSGLVTNYQPDASDPNLSGALSSILWELSLLTKHYDPSISSMAKGISGMATSSNPSQNPAYMSTMSPLQAFADSSIERQLSKPVVKPGSLNRKRKRDTREAEFVILDGDQLRNIAGSIDEEEVKRKFEDHFTVLREIAENERLRAERNRALASVSMYQEYKRLKKLKKVRRISRKKIVIS